MSEALFSDGTELLPGAGAGEDTPPLAAAIHVMGAASGAARFVLRSGRCIVGTAPTCELVLSEASVSRTHVALTLVPEGVEVEDLGSRNGTLYLGQRVQKMTVALGSRLTLGRVTLAIDAAAEALAVPDAVSAQTAYGLMLGSSRAMQQLFTLLGRLEGSLASVLVQGESGVGKELVARALHERSKVLDGPFVAVNCGAFTKELIASELFGHVKGAFTGASANRKGAFEAAHGGSLFLDEIGELPLDVQPMLLRALEAGEVRPVGGDAVRSVRVRIIAATNRDLKAEVEADRFREDLYYRLAVVRLTVPPLRERPDDIPPLALRFGREVGLEDVPRALLARWCGESWPGNVRELRNAVHAYAAVGEVGESQVSPGARLDALFEQLLDLDRPYSEQKDHVVERFTRVYLRLLMARAEGNQSAAARTAGLDRTHLWRLLGKYGV